MKKTLYLGLLLVAASFTSCKGTDDYDAYVSRLKAESEKIEAISSTEQYADYVQSYIMMTDSFARLDIKLDETQADEIKKLNMEISERINVKYADLMQTTDSVAAPAATEPADTTTTE